MSGIRNRRTRTRNYNPLGGPSSQTMQNPDYQSDDDATGPDSWSNPDMEPRYRWHHCRLPHRPTKRCRALPLRVRILPAKHGYPHGFQYGKCARTEKEGHQRLHGRRTSFLVHPFCAFKRTPLATAHLLRNHFAHLNATVFAF